MCPIVNDLTCNFTFGTVIIDSSKSGRVFSSGYEHSIVIVFTGYNSVGRCRTWHFLCKSVVGLSAAVSRRLGTVLLPFYEISEF